MNNTQPSFLSYISGKQLPAAHGAPPEFQAITKTRQTTCTPTTASGGRKNTSITFSPHFFSRVTPFVPYYASLNLFCLCGSGGGEGERGWWPSGSSNDVRAWRHSPWFPCQALFLFFSYQLQVLVRGVAKDPLNHKHIVVYDILAFSHGCHKNVSHVVVVDIKKVFQGPPGWKCVSGAKLAARNNFQTWISHEHPAHVPYKYLHGQK